MLSVWFPPISHLQYSLRRSMIPQGIYIVIVVGENWRKLNRRMKVWNLKYKLQAFLLVFLQYLISGKGQTWFQFFSQSLESLLFYLFWTKGNAKFNFICISAFTLIRLWTIKLQGFQTLSGQTSSLSKIWLNAL